MSRQRFKPDRFDAAVIARGWTVLGGIVAQLAVMLAMAGPTSRLLAYKRLCRIGESLARRLLMARALTRRIPQIKTLNRLTSNRLARIRQGRKTYAPHDVRYRPPEDRRALFRLAEPYASFQDEAASRPARATLRESAVRVEQQGVLTVRIHSTAAIPDWKIAEQAQNNARAVERRLERLQDVMTRPEANIRRMSHWIARQYAQRHGRAAPIRPGRPPGQIQTVRHRNDMLNCLAEADAVARRAAAAVPHPRPDEADRHSPDMEGPTPAPTRPAMTRARIFGSGWTGG